MKCNVPEAEEALADLFPGAFQVRAHRYAAPFVAFGVNAQVSHDEYDDAVRAGPNALRALILDAFSRARGGES
jgi:hypothetical protein